MSLRRRVTLWFLLINGATLLVLGAFILANTSRLKSRFDADQAGYQEQAARLIGMVIKYRTEEELRMAFAEATEAPLDEAFVMLTVSDQSYWDEELLFLENLDKAVLIRWDATSTQLFNPRPRLIFEPADAVEKNGVRGLVENARGVVEATTDVRGRRIFYGRIDVQGGSQWGFYFRLKLPPGSRIDPVDTVRTVLLLTIPGMILLLVFLYVFFNRAVMAPIAEIQIATGRIAEGDLSTPVELSGGAIEFATLAKTMNQMMQEIEDYQSNLRQMVDEANDRFKDAERNLATGRRLAAIGQLAAGIAHEINNPLGGLLNATARLGDADMTPERRAKYVELSVDGIQRIRDIVRKVLDATPRKIEVGSVGVADVAVRATDLIDHRLRTMRVDLDLAVPNELKVLGDRNELVQVFLNLLINACDALVDVEAPKITIAATSLGEEIEICVTDNGCGMDDELRQRVFDLFFTTKPGGEGTGLGLGIVHGIVTGHDGTIAVSEAPGGGSRFLIRLPADPGDAGPAVVG